jgi:hypothetical protein
MTSTHALNPHFLLPSICLLILISVWSFSHISDHKEAAELKDTHKAGSAASPAASAAASGASAAEEAEKEKPDSAAIINFQKKMVSRGINVFFD